MSNSKLYDSCQDVFHPNTTCTTACIESAKTLAKAAARANGPFYVLAALQKKGLNHEMLKVLSMNLIRTVAFYATSVSLYSFFRCYSRKILGRHDKTALFFSGAAAYGLGSIIEEPNQLQGTLVFQGKDTLETFARLLVAWGFPPIKNAPVYVFALSLAILHYYFRHDYKCVQTLPFLLIKLFIGKNRSERDSLENSMSQLYENNPRKTPEEDSWKPLDVIVGVIKNTFIGYFLSVTLALVGGIFTKGFKGIIDSVHAGHVSGKSLAFFLGAVAFLGRGVPILLKSAPWNTDKKTQDIIISLITGFVTGLSLAFWKSNMLASYFLSNALYCICKDLVNRKIITPIPYSVNILYGLSTGISLYALLFENQAVSDSWKEGFLSKMAGGQDPQFYQQLSAVLAQKSNL